MAYPFPDPAVTPEFEADNGITYVWGGDKWVVKTFTSPTNYITPAVADTEYVRVDGTSTMVGDLVFNGNRSVKSADGNIKLNSFGTTELAQGGNTKLTVNTTNVTLDTNLVNNFDYEGINIFAAGTISAGSALFLDNKTVATEDYVQTYAVPANGTTSTTSPFEITTAIRHVGYNSFRKKGNSFFISCESGPTIFGVSTADTAEQSYANYFGKCTSPNHIVNKAYLDNSLPSTLGSTYEYQNKNDNVGSTLTGFFSLNYSKSGDGIVNIIVRAFNDTDINVGDVVGTLPAGYRPAYKSWPVFTLINAGKNITAQCLVTDDGKVTFIQVGGASNEFFGQLTFSTYIST